MLLSIAVRKALLTLQHQGHLIDGNISLRGRVRRVWSSPKLSRLYRRPSHRWRWRGGDCQRYGQSNFSTLFVSRIRFQTSSRLSWLTYVSMLDCRHRARGTAAQTPDLPRHVWCRFWNCVGHWTFDRRSFHFKGYVEMVLLHQPSVWRAGYSHYTMPFENSERRHGQSSCQGKIGAVGLLWYCSDYTGHCLLDLGTAVGWLNILGKSEHLDDDIKKIIEAFQ
jgi:hypothetical protein